MLALGRNIALCILLQSLDRSNLHISILFLVASKNGFIIWNIVSCAFSVVDVRAIIFPDCTMYYNYIWPGNDRITFFTNGAWLEAQGIFGVVDDLSTLYLIKQNGELLTRRTCDQLKLSASIVDLVLQDGSSLLR